MRTDNIFYQMFQTLPSILFELLNQPPELARNYEFSSREVKELARRFDGIFLPTDETSDDLIYFIEIQFQKKADFYWRFFTEIFVYLGQYQPQNNWSSVAIFATRSLDPGIPRHYQGLVLSRQIEVIYLDELIIPENSLGLGLINLVIGDKSGAVAQTQNLMRQVSGEWDDVGFREKVIDLLERILVYKFKELSQEEIEAMFNLGDLRQTRFYQEVKQQGKLEGKQEGKLDSVPGLLALGLTVEQIATALELDVELVRKSARRS